MGKVVEDRKPISPLVIMVKIRQESFGNLVTVFLTGNY